jgi:N-acetyl-anhydromuramyl-L-alanine amidase AmpD
MRVENNLLTDDPRIQPYVPAPRGWASWITIKPEFLIQHFTATMTLQDAFASPYFAQIYIDDGGLIYQKVPLDKCAYHAGVSEWGGRYDLNRFSHGIEHRNYGYLYKDWKGRYYRDGKYIDKSLILDKPHRLQSSLRYWETFSNDLLESSFDVTECLNKHYHYVDIVGHEDVCAKVDPGPAYPLAEMKEKFYGKETESLFMVTRWWPGNDIGAGGVSLKFLPYDWSPSKIWCSAGVVVKKLEWSGRYVKVIRQDGKTGWILEKYLRRILGETK